MSAKRAGPRGLIAAVALVASGCGGLGAGPDGAAFVEESPRDAAAPADAAGADLTGPVEKPADLSAEPTDLAQPPTPDLVAVDGNPPDLAAGADLSMPLDLARRVTSDLASSDFAVRTDLAAPDLATPADGGPRCNSFSLANAVSYAVGGAPYVVAAGDFNGDGKLDLVTGNVLDSSISLLLGTGAGAFAAQRQSFLTGGGAKMKPTGIAVGDFNGDGKLDLVTADFVANQASGASVFLGNGDGTFKPDTYVSVGTGAHDVVALDANGDGKLDIALVWGSGFLNYASLLLGNGDGTFGQPQPHTVDRGPQAIATGDFNGDGRADLATANTGAGTVSVLLGNGDGSFAAQASYQAGSGPIGIAARDLDLDGIPDLVVALNGAGAVGVLGGTKNGVFKAVTLSMLPVVSVAVADFNCDGLPDVAGGSTAAGSVKVGIGDGKLGLGQPSNFVTGNHPLGAVAADLDQDGLPDVAAVNQNDNTVSVLINASK